MQSCSLKPVEEDHLEDLFIYTRKILQYEINKLGMCGMDLSGSG
jgi:hypothetical protein